MQPRIKHFLIIGVAILLVALLLVVPNEKPLFAEGSDEGEKLFQSNCMSCHSIGGGNGIGPDLMNVTNNRDEEWLKQMILDPQALVDSGDETALKLVEEYEMIMPTIEQSEAEVAYLIAYLKDATNKSEGSASGSKSATGGTTHLSTAGFTMYGVLGAIILFVITAVVWRKRLKAVRKSL